MVGLKERETRLSKMKSLLIKIGVGVSVALNLFVFTVSMYGLMTQEARVEENRKWLKETIEKEVYNQIKFVMPKQSGGVVK